MSNVVSSFFIFSSNVLDNKINQKLTKRGLLNKVTKP